MKSFILIVAVSCSLVATARAETCYVDTARVNSTASEPVRLLAEVSADQQKKQDEIESVWKATQKAKPEAQKAEQAKLEKLVAMDNADLRTHRDAADLILRTHLVEAMGKVRGAHRGCSVQAGPGLVVVPGVDVTSEVVKVLNASDPQKPTEEKPAANPATKPGK